MLVEPSKLLYSRTIPQLLRRDVPDVDLDALLSISLLVVCDHVQT